ncbi:MAG: Nif3-like dinuclear metal center hexameric protein [Chloroflexi bacterium]|nr:Nif3-like dinuclear metal center hexameric protein [Chloroflexota bacterium]
MAGGDVTIQAVIDLVIREHGGRMWRTVDGVKAGDPRRPVAGVVTTFLATGAVIKRAAELRANLIITHEPIFYGHKDETGWLEDDPVYRAKRRLLDEHRIVVCRFHDYLHRDVRRDGFYLGMAEALGWEPDPERPFLCSIRPTSLARLARLLKKRLHLQAIRVVGDPRMTCRRVALMVGASGMRSHVEALNDFQADVVVCGEVREWETVEYARDARELGVGKALIVVGHANSEEVGMARLAGWLRQRIPAVPVTHVPAGDPFRVM